MPLTIIPISPDRLAEYASVPMVIDIRSIVVLDKLEVHLPTRPNPLLQEDPIAIPYRKDYDTQDGGPLQWPNRFDLSGWSFWLARDGHQIVGAAAVKPCLSDAILWDIRIHPAHQRKGIATALFADAARWAKSHGYTALKIETQDTNVPANRFYAAQGCRLIQITRDAYRSQPAVADEVMLIWELDLT